MTDFILNFNGAPDKTVASSITQTKQLRLEKHDFGLALLNFFNQSFYKKKIYGINDAHILDLEPN